MYAEASDLLNQLDDSDIDYLSSEDEYTPYNYDSTGSSTGETNRVN